MCINVYIYIYIYACRYFTYSIYVYAYSYEYTYVGPYRKYLTFWIGRLLNIGRALYQKPRVQSSKWPCRLNTGMQEISADELWNKIRAFSKRGSPHLPQEVLLNPNSLKP